MSFVGFALAATALGCAGPTPLRLSHAPSYSYLQDPAAADIRAQHADEPVALADQFAARALP